LSDPQASRLIHSLSLAPHPEGGWYRETWREGDREGGGRGHATAIYFLLEAGQRSHWHRVDAAEMWLFHAGTPLTLLRVASEAGPVERIMVGPDPLAGHHPQAIVPAGWWQAAEAPDGWALVSCIVAPGFEYAGFELAPPEWHPGQ